MRVLAFIEAAGHVCYRYRLEAFSSALANAGLELEAVPLAGSAYGRAKQLRRAREFDVVILQRKLLRQWQLHLLRHWSKRLVYDFDDAVFLRDSFSHKRSESRSRMSLFKEIIAAADGVIAGNDFLQSQALRYAPTSRVRVIPTCVEPRHYPLAAHGRTSANVKLVWIGERSTVRSLVCARPILSEITERLPGIELRVISNAFPEDCGIGIAPRRWSAATEADELAQADIGIAWLPDDDWSRGKCGLKVLQYMAAGLPVVADAVGVHREMVVEGETGFLATSASEWADRIELLAGSPSLRRKMGEQARQRVMDHYSVDRWCGEFVRLVQGWSTEPTPAAKRPVNARAAESLPTYTPELVA